MFVNGSHVMGDLGLAAFTHLEGGGVLIVGTYCVETCERLPTRIIFGARGKTFR